MTDAAVSRPFNIYIVEDEALLVWDMEDIIEAAGHVTIGDSASYDEAVCDPALSKADIAFVDVHLEGERTGVDVCKYIRERYSEIPVFFVTANRSRLPDDLAGGQGVIDKPVTQHALTSILKFLKARAERPDSDAVPPRTLTMAGDV